MKAGRALDAGRRIVERRARPLTDAVGRGALADKVRQLDGVLTGQAARDTATSLDRLARAIDDGGAAVLWLVSSVLRSSLPQEQEVERLHRAVLLDGARETLDSLVAAHSRDVTLGRSHPVRITSGTVVDLHHTRHTHLATGIQRVSRELARHWHSRHELELVGWVNDLTSLRQLSPGEVSTALTGAHERDDRPSDGADTEVLVPWRGRYVLPELALEPERTSRIRALARWSGSDCTAIGFDCVPVTSSETTDVGVSEHFANNLSGLRHFDRVVAISESAATEYRGWGRMLSAIGLPGPQVHAVLLPAQAGEVDDEARERARLRLCLGGMPMVLCVGTHEPRKNHLAVLHAAERAWQSGLRFSLAFIGGNAWSSGEFVAELDRLQAAGRPVENHTGVGDDELWAAFALARFMVFPSLNEGFGLPAAECLSLGTPVLTSGHGSLAEIAAAGGALTTDPRDDDALSAAFQRLLVDDELLARLRAQAARRPDRTWSDYADDVWQSLGGPHER